MKPSFSTFYKLYPHNHFYDLINLFQISKSKTFVSCSKIEIMDTFDFGESLKELKHWLNDSNVNYSISLFGTVTIINFHYDYFNMNLNYKSSIYLINNKILGAKFTIDNSENAHKLISNYLLNQYLEKGITNSNFVIEDIRRDQLRLNNSTLKFLTGNKELLQRCKFQMNYYIKNFHPYN